MVRVTGHRLSRHLRSHAKNLEDNDNGSCGDRSCIWAMSVVAATKTFPEIWGMSHSGRFQPSESMAVISEWAAWNGRFPLSVRIVVAWIHLFSHQYGRRGD